MARAMPAKEIRSRQQAVNQFPCGLVNDFFAGLFDELSSTAMAFESLFTVVNATVLNRFGGCTYGAGGHGRRTAKTLLFYHYILNTTVCMADGNSRQFLLLLLLRPTL